MTRPALGALTVLLLAGSVPAQQGGQQIPQQGDTEQRLKDLEQEFEEMWKELKAARSEARTARPGTSKFLITGYGSAGYTDVQRENSTFGAGFNPIFLWWISDRLYFEGELELELENQGTNAALEYGDLSYVVSDFGTLTMGKFLNPSNYFIDRLHPAWINKLPDRPLPFGDPGLMPESQLGIQLHGAVPIASSSLQYALYVSNGPALLTDSAEEAGRLSDTNFDDNNNSKTLGGRIGYRPRSGMEVGVSLESARVGASGDPDFEGVRASILSLDFNYAREVESLRGRVDVRGQWIRSKVDNAVYDPTGALGFGPLSFDNEREGGYLQAAYRPSKAEGFLENIEPVVRYDFLAQPGGNPAQVDERRWTLGLDYWVGPSAVFKVAYRVEDQDSLGEDSNAFLAQFAIGF